MRTVTFKATGISGLKKKSMFTEHVSRSTGNAVYTLRLAGDALL